MKLARLRLRNFRSFGPEATEIEFDDTTFVLGPNGSGKTAVLQALARMFSLDPAQRKIRPSDFHAPQNEAPDQVPVERELWIEADFEFPELAEEGAEEALAAVPGNFAHMLMATDDDALLVRYRLHANLDQDGDVEETFTAVAKIDPDGVTQEQSRVSKQDRNAIQVHYLPARRDPSDHISYAANTLLGRALRAADWSAEREAIAELTGQMTAALAENSAVAGLSDEIAKAWGDLHKGKFFNDPTISFARSEIDNLLRHLSLSFTPGHDVPLVDFSRLSDGQQSLLYIALVLATREVGDKVLAGESDAFDIDKLRPPVFTLIAIEEPENSLSPHYLGRVIRALGAFGAGRDAQTVVATHAPSLLRRVEPEAIRYLRLNKDRQTVVTRVLMPTGPNAAKYVREAVHAFPELYFARFVILGEGDSEEVVLPRVLAARGVLADDASVSVAPLGGRHVHHFWRLLNGLGIPFVTLLDLDLARHQGGWGRISYAASQLLLFRGATAGIDQAAINAIPAWDSDHGLMVDDDGWIEFLEARGVFFSSPLDLDFMMLDAFGAAYALTNEERSAPDAAMLKAVLGKAHDTVGGQYSDDQQKLFEAYHTRFKLGSKPTWHVRAMAALGDEALCAGMPEALERMFDNIEAQLADLPE